MGPQPGAASAAPSWDSGSTPRPDWEGTVGAEWGPFAALRGPGGWGTWGAVWGPPSSPGLYPLGAASPTESWKPGGQGSPIVASMPWWAKHSRVRHARRECREGPQKPERGLRQSPGVPPEGSQDGPPQSSVQNLTLPLTWQSPAQGTTHTLGSIEPSPSLRRGSQWEVRGWRLSEGAPGTSLDWPLPPIFLLYHRGRGCSPSVSGRGRSEPRSPIGLGAVPGTSPTSTPRAHPPLLLGPGNSTGAWGGRLGAAPGGCSDRKPVSLGEAGRGERGPLAAVFLGWGPPGISGHGWRCATSCPVELGCGCQAPWGAL